MKKWGQGEGDRKRKGRRIKGEEERGRRRKRWVHNKPRGHPPEK